MTQSRIFQLFDDYAIKLKSGQTMDKSGFKLATEELLRDNDSSTLARVQREFKQLNNLLNNPNLPAQRREALSSMTSGIKNLNFHADNHPDFYMPMSTLLGELLFDMIQFSISESVDLEKALIEVWHLRRQIFNDLYETSDKEASAL